MLEFDNNAIDRTELSVREVELRRTENQFYLERDFNRDLWVESNGIRNVAEAHKRAYDEVMASFAVRLLFMIRRRLGKNYQRLWDPVPQGCKGEPFCIDESKQVWVSALPDLVNEMREDSRCSYFKTSGLKIGIVTDNFMYNYYKDAASLVELTPDGYADQIDSGDLDLVLYVSAWQGIGHYGEIPAPENYYYAGPEGVRLACEVLTYAKDAGVPTVFQTIEDPPSYEHFLPVARCADVVFTSAEEMIDRYRIDLGHDNVHLLRYGINPHFQNPIGFCRRRGKLVEEYPFLKKAVFFAGAWYPDFEARCKDTCTLFDGVIEHSDGELFAADRNMYMPYHKQHEFPRKYDRYLVPPLEHGDLQAAHKLFDFTVNVNSVKDSASMCAMRVYEVQAMGGLLLTNYALSVSRSFPGLFCVHDPSEVGRILSGYTDDELVAMQLESVRGMYSGGTVYDRLNEVLSRLGLPEPFPEPPVYVVADDPSWAEGLDPCPRMSVLSPEEAAALSPGEGFLVRLSGPGPRNPEFLVDMANAFKFADADYVAYADCAGGYAGAYEYASGPAPAADALFDLSRVPAPAALAGEPPEGLRGFRVAAPRWGRPGLGGPKELAVIVPVFNNGRYLWGRCFRSLLRSSAFPRMRVYLVDDGSTDGETPAVVARIAACYGNVEAIFLPEGGSGSAARARNAGLDAASEPYVTFLDPDDEAVNDAYAALLGEAVSRGVDVAMGARTVVCGLDKFDHVFMREDRLIEDPLRCLVEERDFEVQGIHCCVIRRDLVERAGLRQEEGALGEDTLFFYQLMAAASKVWHTTTPVHVYYMDRPDSSTGSVGRSFFERSLVGERAMAAFLREAGLIEEFRRRRLNNIINNWYMDKLMLVPMEEIEECASMLNDISKAYE